MRLFVGRNEHMQTWGVARFAVWCVRGFVVTVEPIVGEVFVVGVLDTNPVGFSDIQNVEAPDTDPVSNRTFGVKPEACGCVALVLGSWNGQSESSLQSAVPQYLVCFTVSCEVLCLGAVWWVVGVGDLVAGFGFGDDIAAVVDVVVA